MEAAAATESTSGREPSGSEIMTRVARRAGAGSFAAVTVVPDTARAEVAAPAPSGVAADVAGVDLAAAAAVLRAVLVPATAGAA